MGREIGIDELRDIQLGIMDRIHEYCNTHNLRYFLMYGSQIGAVRHQGFIPWDDDIDIIMPRPDYEKFLSGFDGLNMSVYSFETIPHWPLFYSKICDARTRLVEDNGIETGVFVDVFPLDGLSCNRRTAEKHFKKAGRLKLLLRMHRFAPQMKYTDGGLHGFVLCMFSKMIHALLPYSSMMKRFDRVNKKYGYEESEYCGDLCAGSMNRIFDKSFFSDFIETKFEDRVYRIPREFDSCMRKIYGDYMKLPPVELRVSNHDFKAYWIE